MPANDRAPGGYNVSGFVLEESNNQIRLDHAAVDRFANRDPARLFHGCLSVSRRLDRAFGFAALSTDGEQRRAMNSVAVPVFDFSAGQRHAAGVDTPATKHAFTARITAFVK